MNLNNKTENHKFSNIGSKSKKVKIEKEINEFEDKKSEKIMELGISVYDKIRRGLIDEDQFGELIYEIKKIDLEIYNRMLDIASIEGHDENTPVCKCGYISKNNEKFCPNCGREIKKDRDFILCDVCASKIDSDSKFCVCCGSKVVRKSKVDLEQYKNDDYYEDDDLDKDIQVNEEYEENIDNEIEYSETFDNTNVDNQVGDEVINNTENQNIEEIENSFEVDQKADKIELTKKETLNEQPISDKIYIGDEVSEN